MLGEAFQLSGALRTEANNMVEALARQEAIRDLGLICGQVTEVVQGIGLDISYEVFRVIDTSNEYLMDAGLARTNNCLEITVTYHDERLAA